MRAFQKEAFVIWFEWAEWLAKQAELKANWESRKLNGFSFCYFAIDMSLIVTM